MATIRLRDNQAIITRGITYRSDSQAFYMDMKEGEVDTIQVQFSDILATGETITAEVLNSDLSLTASVNGSLLTLTATQGTYSASARVKVTRSSGKVHILDFVFEDGASLMRDDYGTRVA